MPVSRRRKLHGPGRHKMPIRSAARRAELDAHADRLDIMAAIEQQYGPDPVYGNANGRHGRVARNSPAHRHWRGLASEFMKANA